MVLRSFRELAQSNEGLALTIARVGFDAFKKAVAVVLEAEYNQPHARSLGWLLKPRR